MVPGEGPQPAPGMVVGEAPGRQEVEQGRPFVGKAGKLLDSVLRAVGVARDEVYITNVVKELPLDSEGRIRRPFAEEIESWYPILLGEIQNTAPAAILALGKTASRTLTNLDVPPGSKIENVYTAWHPAYLIYNGESWRWGPMMDDWLEQIQPWAEAIA